MSVSQKRRPSFQELYDEIRRLGEGVTGEILAPGEVWTMSRPGMPHQHALKMIEHALAPFDPRTGGRGWWIAAEMEIRLPDERLAVPDLVGWRVERVPALPSTNPIEVIPAFCAEILSPSTAVIDRAVKLPLYAKSGIQHVWLVDPALRLVEVYETARERPALVTTAIEGASVALPPFDAPFSVAPWWMPQTAP